MKFSLICAFCNKRGIGNNNSIPWKITDDLKEFKKITTNGDDKNILIMGRNTWESIPSKFRPLDNRYNIVISSKSDFIDSDKVDYIGNSFENILEYIDNKKTTFEKSKIFIIGGEMLYKYVLMSYTENIDTIYITEIYKSFECDKFFPKIDDTMFMIEQISDLKYENDIYFRYFTYKQNNSNNIKYCNKEELQFKNFIQNILDNGLTRNDRTGVGTISLFAPTSMKYDLSSHFPLCTIKRGFFRAVFEELMLYIRGQTDNNILKEKNSYMGWKYNTRVFR